MPQNNVLVSTMAERFNIFSSESENEGSSSESYAARAAIGARIAQAVSYVAPALVDCALAPQCPSLLQRLPFCFLGPAVSSVALAPVDFSSPAVSHVARASVDRFSGLAVSNVALALVVEYLAPAVLVALVPVVEYIAPAPVEKLAVASTPFLSGESCQDELRGATEVPTMSDRLHDERLHAERVLRARGIMIG